MRVLIVLRALLLPAAIVALAVLTSGCLPPTPGPQPNPPGPTPGPVVDSVWLIVVEESASRTPESAAVIRELPSIGQKWRVYDDDSPDAAGYAAAVTDRPGLLVLGPDGTVLRAGKLPQNIEGVRSIVREVVR